MVEVFKQRTVILFVAKNLTIGVAIAADTAIKLGESCLIFATGFAPIGQRVSRPMEKTSKS